MKSKRSGFTLAELLAVVAILGIVLAMAVPAFIGLSKGSGMNTSIAELRTTLTQARQWAITHRESTFVVFPNHHKNLYGGGNQQHVEKAFRAYNAYTESEGYIGEWRFLQPGIYFIPRETFDPSSPGVVNNSKNVFASAGVPTDVDFPNSGDSPQQRVLSIEFKRDGTVNANSLAPPALYLGEGVRIVDYVAGEVDVTNFKFAETSPVFGVEVSPFTGLVSVKDYQPIEPSP